MMLKGLTAQLSSQADLSGAKGRQHPRPRRCRWRRIDSLSVGQGAGSQGHRGGGKRGEGGARASNGCRHVLILGRDEIVAAVRKITGGEGVAVVYDSIGKDTFFSSLDCLRPLGMMVTFGNASGPVPPFAPLELSKRGSLFLTRPTLFHYIAKRQRPRSRGARTSSPP